jgi:hypothetical protein
VLEQLLHPIVIRFVLEDTQQAKVCIFQMTIHFGTATTIIFATISTSSFTVVARGSIPLLSVCIEVLILANSTAFIF